MQNKTCPSCGKTFRCESEKDCWCETYQIHKKDMLEITSLYKDCICPECLSGYAEK